MIKGTLRTQLPHQGNPLSGMLSADEGNLVWWDDLLLPNARVLAKLEKADIVSASTRGIVFKGYEPIGPDKTGRPTFKYQEWWIATKL